MLENVKKMEEPIYVTYNYILNLLP